MYIINTVHNKDYNNYSITVSVCRGIGLVFVDNAVLIN